MKARPLQGKDGSSVVVHTFFFFLFANLGGVQSQSAWPMVGHDGQRSYRSNLITDLRGSLTWQEPWFAAKVDGIDGVEVALLPADGTTVFTGRSFYSSQTGAVVQQVPSVFPNSPGERYYDQYTFNNAGTRLYAFLQSPVFPYQYDSNIYVAAYGTPFNGSLDQIWNTTIAIPFLGFNNYSLNSYLVDSSDLYLYVMCPSNADPYRETEVHCLDALSGNNIWTTILPSPLGEIYDLFQSPQDQAIVATLGGGLHFNETLSSTGVTYYLSQSAGQILWFTPVGGNARIITDQGYVIVSDDSAIWALDNLGNQVWTIPTSSDIIKFTQSFALSPSSTLLYCAQDASLFRVISIADGAVVAFAPITPYGVYSVLSTSTSLIYGEYSSGAVWVDNQLLQGDFSAHRQFFPGLPLSMASRNEGYIANSNSIQKIVFSQVSHSSSDSFPVTTTIIAAVCGGAGVAFLLLLTMWLLCGMYMWFSRHWSIEKLGRAKRGLIQAAAC